jgi:hypothetical protein
LPAPVRVIEQKPLGKTPNNEAETRDVRTGTLDTASLRVDVVGRCHGRCFVGPKATWRLSIVRTARWQESIRERNGSGTAMSKQYTRQFCME